MINQRRANNQIWVKEGHEPIDRWYDKYEYTIMPYSLMNCPAVFFRFMN